MKSASVPRPFAELLIKELHDMSVPHYDGWHRKVIDGYTIRKLGPVYRLQHGRASLGEVTEVTLSIGNVPGLVVLLASGLAVVFPIREPRKVVA